jgi:hypothetical protein
MRINSILGIFVLVGCGSTGGGGGGGGNQMGGGDDDPSVDAAAPPKLTLVGDWKLALEMGENEIVMSSTSSGTAQWWWYGGGEADWLVSADDNGAGTATLTLECTSQNCATAEPIVFACTYTYVDLHCVGQSGGINNNFDGDVVDLAKQGT